MTDVVTLTMNPAVDLFTTTGTVEPTHKLRCGPVVVHPGGGGINVARLLRRLGSDVLAVFPAGGVTGRRLQDLLGREAVPHEAVAIADETRENFSAHEAATGLDYRFVLAGPALSGSEWQACLELACRAAAGARFVVASGSLPPGAPADFYARLARRLAAQGVRLVLDTSGPPLAAALDAGVHLVKPSLRELNELTGEVLDTQAQRHAACRALVQAGQAQVVALSLGAEGGMVVDASGAWQALALQVPVLSTIGAGDSFVGGLVFALARGDDLPQAFAHAMAASAAALQSEGTALCRPEDVSRLLPRVRVQPIA